MQFPIQELQNTKNVIKKHVWKSTTQNTVCNQLKSKNVVKNLDTPIRLTSFQSGTEIKIQGYENFALDALLKTYTEQQLKTSRRDQPEIWYTDEKSQRHRYFSDIFIPHKNLIIEVKSTWTYEKGMKQGKLVLQREACLRAGYDYKYMVYTDLGKEYFPSY